MKRLLLLTFCLGSTLLVTVAAGAKGPPRANFSMTIDDFLSNGLTATVIRSDGRGSYTNGVDGVTINSSVLNFWPRTDLGTRNVSFNNNGFLETTALPPPVVNDTDIPPTGTTGVGQSLQDPHGALSLPTPMENMVSGTQQCGAFFLAARDSSTGFVWRLANFQYAKASGSGTSYVVVRRVDSTHWTVESDFMNLCSTTHYPNEGMVLHDEPSGARGKNTTITHADGYYSIPFHFTYTLE